jgi:hypothetical protein
MISGSVARAFHGVPRNFVGLRNRLRIAAEQERYGYFWVYYKIFVGHFRCITFFSPGIGFQFYRGVRGWGQARGSVAGRSAALRGSGNRFFVIGSCSIGRARDLASHGCAALGLLSFHVFAR